MQLEKLSSKDIVICNNEIIEYLQNEIFKNKLIPFKIINYTSYLTKKYQKTDKDLLLLLLKENINFEFAKVLINNYPLQKALNYNDINIEDKVKKILDNNITINENIFKNYNIHFINPDYTNDLIYLESKKANIIDIKPINNLNTFITECNNKNDEIIHLANLISKRTTDENLIIYVPDNEYLPIIKEIFNFYNFDYNISSNTYLSEIDSIKYLIKIIKDEINTKDDSDTFGNIIKEIFNKINNIPNEIYNILNQYIKYSNYEFKLLFPDFINTLNNTKININKKDAKIEITNKLPKLLNNKILYIVGANLNTFPVIIKDDDYLEDKIKINYKLKSIKEKNAIINNNIKDIINSTKYTYISYNINKNNQKSDFIDILDDVEYLEYDNINNYAYSFDKYMLAKAFDKYIKYNYEDKFMDDFKDLNTVKLYKSYNNEYKGKFKINKKLVISYTQLDNFYKCSYKYYLNYILKITNAKSNEIAIGNFFHDALKNLIKDETYDINSKLDNYFNDTDINKYYQNRLVEYVKIAYKIIKSYQEKGKLITIECEKEYQKDIANDSVIGIVDKIMSIEINNQKHYIVIDYKTGKTKIDLELLEYGLFMQLPFYFYLTKEVNSKILGGYLQKILPEKIYDKEENKSFDEQFYDEYKYLGYTLNDINLYTNIDQYDSLSQSFVKIKVKNAKLTEEEFINITKIVEKNILYAIENIHEGNFKINPKMYKKENTCKYCEYASICYKSYKDFINLKLDSDLSFLRGKK